MKITIDKNYTTLAQAAKVRADVKEFKARYVDGDLVRAAEVFTGKPLWVNEFVRCTISAFPAGSAFGDETSFSVDLLIVAARVIYKVHYYCDINLTVDMRPTMFGDKLYSIREYRECEC